MISGPSAADIFKTLNQDMMYVRCVKKLERKISDSVSEEDIMQSTREMLV